MTATAAARDTFGVFGTTAVLLVTDPAALGAARLLADAELAAVDQACSRFRPDSELARLNQAGGAPRPVSPVFADLIATALRAAELTDGLVDPTCAAALVSLGYDRDFSHLAASSAGLPAGCGAAARRRARPGWRRAGARAGGRMAQRRAGPDRAVAALRTAPA